MVITSYFVAMISNGETVVDLSDISHCTSNSWKCHMLVYYSDIAFILFALHGKLIVYAR